MIEFSFKQIDNIIEQFEKLMYSFEYVINYDLANDMLFILKTMNMVYT